MQKQQQLNKNTQKIHAGSYLAWRVDRLKEVRNAQEVSKILSSRTRLRQDTRH